MIEQPSRRVDQPEPCFVRLRLVNRGPYVAARISQPFGLWQVTVNGSSSTPIQHARSRPACSMSGRPASSYLRRNITRCCVTRRAIRINRFTRQRAAWLRPMAAEQEERDYWATRPIYARCRRRFSAGR